MSRGVGVVMGLLVLGACTTADEPEHGAVAEVSAPIPHPFAIELGPGAVIGGMELGRPNPPLLIIHGGPGMDHLYLRPAFDELADEYQVVYVDQRGTGLSDTPVTPDWISFDALVEDIDRVREWAGSDRIRIVAHSWGARLGLEYAHRHPERVERMVLIGPADPSGRYRAAAAERMAARTDPTDTEALDALRQDPLLRQGDPGTVARFYELSFRPIIADPDALDLEVPLHPRTARNGFGVMGALGPSMPTGEFWEQMSEIPVPTLVIQGEHDGNPPEMAHAMADVLGDGRALILEDAGHFPYIETPTAFFEALRGFLAAGDPP